MWLNSGMKEAIKGLHLLKSANKENFGMHKLCFKTKQNTTVGTKEQSGQQ